MPKTDAPKPEKKNAPAGQLAHVAQRYQAALPHVAAEIAAYGLPAQPLAEGEKPAEMSPVDLFKRSLMDAMVQLDACGKAKMMGEDVVVERQRVLVQMLSEMTAAPASK
jgi:hypothetical protein